MTKEQKFLLYVLNTSLNNKEIVLKNEFADIDWKILFEESIKQSVVLQCFDKLTPIKDLIPQEIYSEWKTLSLNLLIHNSLVSQYQKDVVEIFNNNNITYAVIKGEASSGYYNKPELRVLGDVDIIINDTDKNAVKDLMTENGYVALMEGHKSHTVFKKENAHIEIHHRLAGIPDGKIGNIINNKLTGILDNTLKISADNYSFSVFTDYYHALVLLLHMQHHLTGDGLGLRHLVDWASFIQKTYNEDFWTSKLLPFLKEIGLLNFMAIINKICEKYFDSPCVFENNTEEDTVELILEDILNSGNFGSKDKMRQNSALMISKTNSFKRNKWHNLFLVFKNSVYEQHAIVRKYKILYPIFFIYRFLRYFVLVLFNKRVIFTKAIPQADERIKLYERLQLFGVESNE